MKYKISFIIVLCLNTSYMQANPLSDVCKNTKTGSVAALAFHAKVATGAATWKGKHYSFQQLAEQGFFNNALYLRLLLSEFYCARCAIGASPFTNGNLKQVTSWPSVTSNDNGTLKSGGFDAKTIQAFITKANGYATKLQKAREYFDFNNKPTSTNPIKSFAGVIIVPSKKFIAQLGKIQIQNKVIDGPTFFGYQTPSKPSTTISNAISTTSLTVGTGTLSTTGVSTVSAAGTSTVPAPVTAQEADAIKLTLEGQLQPPGMPLTPHTLCDLTLTNYKSNVKTGENKPLQCYLNSIEAAIGTMKDSVFQIEIFNKLRTPNINQKKMIDFFLQTPSNPWALVIILDGEFIPATKAINILASIPSIVQLSPGTFTQYTQLNSEEYTDLETLLAMPSDLYYNVQNTQPGEATPTARLLRGICNGYLTSWNYHQLEKPNLSQWKPVHKSTWPISYPTPKVSQFEKNNPNTMFYALYGARQALNYLYLNDAGIPAILDIIKDPNTSRTGYTVIGEKNNTITNVIGEMGGITKYELQELKISIKQTTYNLQKALQAVLALPQLTSSQKKKLIIAQVALDDLIVSSKNSSNIMNKLKAIASALAAAGGSVAWPYPANKVLKSPAAINFIAVEEAFREIIKNLQLINETMLISLIKEANLQLQQSSTPAATNTTNNSNNQNQTSVAGNTATSPQSTLEETCTHLQTTLQSVLNLPHLTSNQKHKITIAQTALNDLIDHSNSSNSPSIINKLKTLTSALSAAGGGVAWPHPSNKVLKAPAAKNFIAAEESFRQTTQTLQATLGQTKLISLFKKANLKLQQSSTLPAISTTTNTTSHLNSQHQTPPAVNTTTNTTSHLNSQHQTPNNTSDDASIKAYKKGYRAGQAASKKSSSNTTFGHHQNNRSGEASIKAYKKGYRAGQATSKNLNADGNYNFGSSLFTQLENSFRKIKSLFLDERSKNERTLS